MRRSRSGRPRVSSDCPQSATVDRLPRSLIGSRELRSRVRVRSSSWSLVTAVWGVTFVQVKDAVAIYPLFAFLALRFAIAAATLAVPAAPRLRTLGRGGIGAAALAGSLLGAGYALQTAGLERTTVSSTGFITGMYVVLTPLLALALFRTRDRRGSVGRRRARDRRARDARRHPRRFAGRRPARARRRGGLLPADRADGALRAALRRARVHARRDGRGVRRLARRRDRRRAVERAARLDRLGRADRDRGVRERARVPRPDLGAAAGERERRRRSSSRSSRSGRRSSASRSRATGSAWSAGSAAP